MINIMKKSYLFLATAIIALASCSENTYLGENESGAGSGAISFNMNTPSLSRADQSHTASAATLNNQFIVWGEKSASAESKSAGTPVFINYVVNYGASTAGTTESNSSDWEYVAQTPYANTKVVASATPTHVTEQTIKYWDFTNKYYTFTAISALPSDISGGKVTITKNVTGTSTAYEKGYTVAVKEGASADKIYFADRTLVEAGESTRSIPVTLNFRSLMSQVRFGFYETIPGYSVAITDVKYNSTSHTTNAAGNFGVDCSGAVLIPGASTSFTVTYDDGSVIAGNANKAKVAVAGSNTQNYLSTTAASFFGTTLGTSSDARTWENEGKYTKILPNPSNTTDLTLTISYRLTSTDGSGETIDITDRTAKVPAAYAKWKSNYAYTYLFKISDNNGLYPITFDAVVVEDEAGNQETITTVSEPSITSYAKAGAVLENNEYLTGNNIYVAVEDGTTNPTLTVGDNVNFYTVTIQDGAAQTITEASVANALVHGTHSGDTWTVHDALGKDMVVTKNNSLLEALSNIPAADSPTGAVLAIKCAKFAPAEPGFTVLVQDNDYTIGSTDMNGKYTRTGLGTTESPYVYHKITVTTTAADGVTYCNKTTTSAGYYVFEYIYNTDKKAYKVIKVVDEY